VNNLTRTVPNVVYGVMPREQAAVQPGESSRSSLGLFKLCEKLAATEFSLDRIRGRQ
jgi:hypothetical protein